MLNYKIAKSIFLYRSDGTLVWKVRPSQRTKAGDVVGSLNGAGYISTKYKKSQYQVHRLIWLLHHRKFPKGSIDHINGDKADNRISNLRVCTQRENCSNKKIHREGKQVGYSKSGKFYQAWISISGRGVYLGQFKTEKEAVEKYQQALRKHNSL
jgi:hypothetical protein